MSGLLDAHGKMDESNVLVVAARQELVWLYDAWHRPKQADAWRLRLASSPSGGNGDAP